MKTVKAMVVMETKISQFDNSSLQADDDYVNETSISDFIARNFFVYQHWIISLCWLYAASDSEHNFFFFLFKIFLEKLSLLN